MTLEDTANYYGTPEQHPEHGNVEMVQAPPTPDIHVTASRRMSAGSEIAPDEVVEDSDSDSDHRPSDVGYRPNAIADIQQCPPGDPSYVPPLASIADAKQFFLVEGNWQYLLGTSLAWLFLDFACKSLIGGVFIAIADNGKVYGLGLSSPQIVSHIWEEPNPKNPPSVFQALRDNSLHTLVMVSIGTVVGGLLMVKLVKHVSPKVIQFWGFLVLFILFIVTGSAWTTLLDSSRSGLIVLYVLSHIAFNLGPNVTTFIIPAEIFPTRYRCTCHGIAAASGKLGSWVVQIFLAYAFKSNQIEQQLQWERESFGHVLQVMSAFMLAGAVVTWFLVPETRHHNNSRTLEVLACGKKVIDELNKQQKREAEEE